MAMVYTIDPLSDPRWIEFVNTHERASIFHTHGWLAALSRTYGYKPVVYSTSPPNTDLTDGLVLCQVNSWLTGRRLVSLPFSDHCEPLLDGPNDRRAVLESLAHAKTADVGEHFRPKYVELRPRVADGWGELMARSDSYAFHVLDLRSPLEDIFSGFHKSTVQRKIRRGEREHLDYQTGRSAELLLKFYDLLLLTRRRHGLPPQPIQWFRNLIAALKEDVTIRVASKGGRAVAAILTLTFRDTTVYKYGCSDSKYHNLGAMQSLLWNAIQEAKEHGAHAFDWGRSDRANQGLIDFKDRWGAARSELTYFRYPGSSVGDHSQGRSTRLLKYGLRYIPKRVMILAGRVLYPHLG